MPAHTPNRALNRHQLETIAWQVTPDSERRGSGSRREVLVKTSQGMTSQPLADMTDNQIRRYIGPKALEEGGDMKHNGREGEFKPTKTSGERVADLKGGAYYVTKEPDGMYYAWSPSSRGPDWTYGFRTKKLAVEEIERLAGVSKDDPGESPYARLRRLRTQTPNASRKPKFAIGDRVTRKDDLSSIGTIGYIGADNGVDYGGYKYKVDWDNGAPRHYQDEDKLRWHTGVDVKRHRQNASRTEPDETAARELSLYLENDYSLVGAPNSQGKQIEKTLLQKIRNGSFSLEKSEQAWMYLMETGAKQSCKEFSGTWSVMFNKATRELVAHEFATTFYADNKGSR